VDAVSNPPFGMVVRRQFDGMTVLVLGVTKESIQTDEIGLNPGMAMGFVLDRGNADADPFPTEYWPLRGTCSITDIQKDEGARGWDILE